MSDDYYVYFENPKEKINMSFVGKVIRWLLSRDCKFLSFWVEGDEVKATLEEAVERLSNRGSISFLYGQNNGISLQHYGGLTLVCHPVNFTDNRPFTDFFIDVVKKMYFELKAERAYGTLALYSYAAKDQDAIQRRDHISWINIFGPETVSQIGLEKLARVKDRIENPLNNTFVKSYKAELLHDGSFLLVLTASPREASYQMREKLRQVLFYER